MTPEELEALSTRDLLKRLQKLRACEEYHDLRSWYEEEVALFADMILFKDDPRWAVAFKDLKEILATREHIPRRNKRRKKRAN